MTRDQQRRCAWLLQGGLEIVWKTIHRDLPSLHSKIQDAQASVRDQDIEGVEP